VIILQGIFMHPERDMPVDISIEMKKILIFQGLRFSLILKTYRGGL